MTRRLIIALSLLALASPLAHAQQPPAPRGVVSINGGWQASDRTFSDSFSFDQYGEPGRVDVDYDAKAGPVFEGGLGVRLWKALGFGVSFSSYKDTSPATVTATVPHPFFFSRAREIEGTVNTKREETTINAQIMAFVPAGARVLLVLSAGPSYMTVRQTLVSSVRWDESYPYDTATFRVADTLTPSESVTGFNAGADVIFRLGRSFGLGALVRYTQGKADLSPAEGRTITVDLGGLQAGGGIRLIF
jgi:opacity protein-like surface antigen